MAKKVRKKKIVSLQATDTLIDAKTSYQAFTTNILDKGNRNKFLRQLGSDGKKDQSSFYQQSLDVSPQEILLDETISHIGGLEQITADRYWISDEFNHRIVEVDEEWRITKSFGTQGSDNCSFYYPRAILKLRSGEVAIIDSWNHRVKLYDIGGNFLYSIGEYGSGDGCFFEPSSIAENPSGVLYVLDRCNHRIAVCHEKKILYFIGERGSQHENNRQRFLAFNPSTHNKLFLEYPSDILWRNGKLYIADAGNQRLVEFQEKGSFVRTLKGFNSPQKIFFPGETIAVVDMNGQRVVHIWENGETAFAYRFPVFSMDEGELFPEAIFPYGDSLLFTFSNSRRLLKLPISSHFVSSLLDEGRKVLTSYQFLLQETRNALEEGEIDIASKSIARLLQENETNVLFEDIELLLPSLQRLAGNAGFYEQIELISERFALAGKERLQVVLNNVEARHKELIAARVAYAEAEGDYLDSTIPENENILNQSISSAKERFEMQEGRFFSSSTDLYKTISLLNQLLNGSISCQRLEALKPFNDLLLLSDMLLDLIARHLQQRETYLPSQSESECLQDGSGNQLNLSIKIRQFLAYREEERLIALLFDTVSLLLPTLTRSIQLIGKTSNSNPLIIEVTNKLLEFATHLQLRPLEEKNDYFLKGIEIYLEAFSCKFPREVEFGSNPEIVSFFAFLTQKSKELPSSITPLTNLQVLLLAKRGVMEEELHALIQSMLPNTVLEASLGAISHGLRGIENQLSATIEEIEGQGKALGEKRHLLNLFYGNQSKSMFLIRETRILEISLGRLETLLQVSLYQYRLLLSYRSLGNYIVFLDQLEKNDISNAVKELETSFLFGQTIESKIKELNNTINKLKTEILKLIERRDSGLQQEINERMDHSKNLIRLQIESKLPKTLLKHYSIAQKIVLNFQVACIARLNAIREESTSDDSVQEVLEQLNVDQEFKETLLNSMSVKSRKAIEVRKRMDFVVEIESARQEEFFSLLKNGESFLVFCSKSGQLKRYSKDWIDLGVALQFQGGKTVRAIGVDSCQNLYVPEKNGLLVYDHSLDFKKYYHFNKQVISYNILSIAIINGKVLLCDPPTNRILSINTNTGENPHLKVECDKFLAPTSILPLADGNVLLTHRNERLLQIVDSNWNVLHSFDNSQAKISAKSFRSAIQDSSGRFWAISPDNAGIYAFDENLNYLFRYGNRGIGEHEFLSPRSLYHQDDILYVMDFTLNRIVSIRPLASLP